MPKVVRNNTKGLFQKSGKGSAGIESVETLLNTTIKVSAKPPRAGDQSRTKANIDKARKLLGYNPTTTLKEGLKAQIAWFEENFIK